MPRILACGRQRQENEYKFKGILVYIENSMPARATRQDPVSLRRNERKRGEREGGRKSYACMSVLLLDNNVMSALEMSFCA